MYKYHKLTNSLTYSLMTSVIFQFVKLELLCFASTYKVNSHLAKIMKKFTYIFNELCVGQHEEVIKHCM